MKWINKASETKVQESAGFTMIKVVDLKRLHV